MDDNLMFTPDEINSEISSNYDGKEDIYAYDGKDDVYLNFDGNRKSLKEMDYSTRRFGFVASNTSPVQKVIAISTGSFDTRASAQVVLNGVNLEYTHPNGGAVLPAPAGAVAGDILLFETETKEIIAGGHNLDAVLDDGVIWTNPAGTQQLTITAAQKNASVRHFLKYVKNNPTHFVGLHIVSNNEAMYETEILTRNTNPYGVYAETRIALQDYFVPSNFNTKKIIVTEQFQIDGETLALVTVPGNSVVTFTMVAGVIESAAHALKTKIKAFRHGGLPGKPLMRPPLHRNPRTLKRF